MSFASLSDCGTYRYALYRCWAASHMKPIMWLMLNPSTADTIVDDQTILKCIKFSKAWGYGAMWVGNLYAYRATNPKELKSLTFECKVGSRNYLELRTMTLISGAIVAAWGAHGEPTNEYLQILRTHHSPVYCLGKNKNGSPKHPLYLRDNTPLQRFFI